MTQQIILLLVQGLAIGFLLGVGAMLLFSEHLKTARVRHTCVTRLAEPPQDLTAIAPQYCSYSLEKQCSQLLRDRQITRDACMAGDACMACCNKELAQTGDHDEGSVAIVTAQNGTYKGDSWLVRYKGQTTIGRVNDCDIVLEDHDISQLHAQITHRIHLIPTHEFAIFDYSSTNNTKVNGQPINGVASLKDGDQVQIGKSEFIFRRV